MIKHHTQTRNLGTKKRHNKRSHTTLKYGGGKRAKAVRQALGKIVPDGIRRIFRKGQHELSPLTPPNQEERYPVSEKVVVSQKKTPSPLPEDNSEEERENKAKAKQAREITTQSKEISPYATAYEVNQKSEPEYVTANEVFKKPTPPKTTIANNDQNEREVKMILPPKTERKSVSPLGTNATYVSPSQIRKMRQQKQPQLPVRLYTRQGTQNTSPPTNLYDVLLPTETMSTTITQTTPQEELERLPRRGSIKKNNKLVLERFPRRGSIKKSNKPVLARWPGTTNIPSSNTMKSLNGIQKGLVEERRKIFENN